MIYINDCPSAKPSNSTTPDEVYDFPRRAATPCASSPPASTTASSSSPPAENAQDELAVIDVKLEPVIESTGTAGSVGWPSLHEDDLGRLCQ